MHGWLHPYSEVETVLVAFCCCVAIPNNTVQGGKYTEAQGDTALVRLKRDPVNKIITIENMYMADFAQKGLKRAPMKKTIL